MFDVQKLLKQAQQMQKDIEKIQGDLATQEVTGTAGGGAVVVTCDGRGDIKSIKLTDEAMGDRETLEDLLLAGIKEATEKASKLSQDKLSSATQGMNIPGLPFGK